MCVCVKKIEVILGLKSVMIDTPILSQSYIHYQMEGSTVNVNSSSIKYFILRPLILHFIVIVPARF